ncbi:type i secretion membrane fusion [Lasius niger]|uniref:Type i secretion membrane fusion n=1 Tax=Lasius niger TaxID=67767 RepID=A0A0J7N1X5_LASNI|nr:type i secretion membrane fusion [Lasius niger]
MEDNADSSALYLAHWLWISGGGLSSQLKLRVQRRWIMRLAAKVSGVKKPIGSKIRANSESIVRLVHFRSHGFTWKPKLSVLEYQRSLKTLRN